MSAEQWKALAGLVSSLLTLIVQCLTLMFLAFVVAKALGWTVPGKASVYELAAVAAVLIWARK